MKKIIFFISLTIGLFTACSNNEEVASSNEKASVTINLAGSDTGSSVRNVGVPTIAMENGIKTFTVYVFASGILEKTQTFTNATTGTMTGLKTGAKRIVVIANAPASFPILVVGAKYTDLASTSNYIVLDDQKDLTNGLTMSGEVDASLDALPTTNQVNVNISRIVAKIVLGSITITPDPGYDAAKLIINGVAIIKAKSKSSIGIPSVVTANPLYSGIEGPTVTGVNIKQYLFETISKTDFVDRYFYVFANTNTNDDATLMTISGTYDGKTVYYPFVIDIPKGQYIQRNTIHRIDVTLKRLGAGSIDPETPSYPATLDVTVTPQNWIVAPVQSVVW